jgi:hypothetical protein
MQLAMYSRSTFYDHETKTRTPLGGVSQDLGIVIHLPAGEGACRLEWVDIAAGWESVQLATQVKAHRSKKKWMWPFNPVAVVREEFPEAEAIPLTLLDHIGMATSRAELEELYRDTREQWTEEHTRAAKMRTLRLHGQVLKDAAAKAATRKRESEDESDW